MPYARWFQATNSLVGIGEDLASQVGQTLPDGSVAVFVKAMPTGQPPFRYDSVNQQAVAFTLPAPPVAKPIDFGAHVTATPAIVATGMNFVTGHWLANWTGGHDGGALSSLARGGSVTLTGGTADSLILALDQNGNLTLRRIGLRDYTVSLNLFGR